MKNPLVLSGLATVSLAQASLPSVPEEREPPQITHQIRLKSLRSGQYSFTLRDGDLRVTGILDEYSGFNLKFRDLRITYGNGLDRNRISLAWEKDADNFFGVSETVLRGSKQRSFFTGLGDNNLRLEATLSDDQWRARALVGRQISIGGGQNNDLNLGNLSFQNRNIWISSDFGERRPTELRVVVGKIDNTRSDLVYGTTNRGRNEISTAQDPTIRFTTNDYEVDEPNFQLGRSMPFRFLGEKAGSLAFDGRAFTSGRFDASLGIRLSNKSYGILGVERRLGEGITWNGEYGVSPNKDLEIRFRIERGGRQLGALVSVRF